MKPEYSSKGMSSPRAWGTFFVVGSSRRNVVVDHCWLSGVGHDGQGDRVGTWWLLLGDGNRSGGQRLMEDLGCQAQSIL